MKKAIVLASEWAVIGMALPVAFAIGSGCFVYFMIKGRAR
jgi:hypothetical protein